LAFYESNVYYIIRCPHCHKGLRLTDEQLPPEYRKVTQNPPVITISNSEEIMSDTDDEQLVKNYRDCSASMHPTFMTIVSGDHGNDELVDLPEGSSFVYSDTVPRH